MVNIFGDGDGDGDDGPLDISLTILMGGFST